MILGAILILTGVVWLFQGIGWVDSTIWSLYWPLILISLGLSVVFNNDDQCCMMCKIMDKSSKVKNNSRPVSPVQVKSESVIKKPEVKSTIKKPAKTTAKKK